MDDFNRVEDGEYCGQILNENYSPALKRRVSHCIECFRAFAETGNPAIPYISAWQEEDKKIIWYEFVSGAFLELLECQPKEAADKFRNSVIGRHIYKYFNIDPGIRKEIISGRELNGARKQLRHEGKTSGIIEAVYKVSLEKKGVIWLKDQATVEIHEQDGICLSLGCLTVVSKEMEAEDELEKHRNRLEELVQKRTVELTDANSKLKQEIEERKRAEESLQQSYNKLQKTMDGIIQAMSMTVEVRDPYTAGHQRRATELAMAIAREMGLSEHRIKGIQMAGLIHDMGKICVPAEILSRPGKLSDAEFQLIKNHPQIAYEILKEIDFPWPVDKIVLQHHERIDGSGYPQGLRGEETLLEAKILSVADVVETVASHRPYRPGLGIEKALEEISHHRGVLYDPDVVDACLKLLAG
jgi:HD-GYP domain-containing protein (c-di-GMP phosphodiesterase class II)